MHGFYGSVLPAILFSILRTTPLAEAADVQIPCKRPGMTSTQSIGLRACTDVIQDLSKTLGAGTPTPGLIQKTIDGYYAGSLQLPIVAGSEQTVKSQALIKPYCNLVAGKFNANTAETDQNHLRESCGKYAEIQVDTLGKVTIDLTTGRGTWEESHIRGGFIQAVNCSYQQVFNEMQQKSAITLTDTCAALGEDIQNLGNQASTVATKIESDLTGQANVSLIENCAAGTAPAGTSSLQQSACLLQAARSRLETAFAYFAACEIMSRARTSYRHRFVDDVAGLTQTLQDKVASPCETRCKKECKLSASCAESCAKSCYRPLIQKTLEDLLKTYWPNSGACAGLLALGGRRGRRRRGKGSRATHAGTGAQASSVHQALALALLLTVGPACSENVAFDSPCRASDQSTVSDPKCCQSLSCGYLRTTYGVESNDDSSCTDYGTPLADMSAVEGCAVSPADDSTPEDSSLTNGAGSAGAAETAIGAANDLVSGTGLTSYDPSSDVTGSDALPTTAAAIAKTTSNPTTKSDTGGAATGTGSSSSPSAGSSRTAGTSGAVGQTGAGLTFPGSGTGAAAQTGALTAGGSGGTDAGGAYQSGGTGGALGGSGVRYAAAGAGAVEGAATGNSVSEVSRPEAQTEAAGTPDAEDYFTRVGLEDSLFKIVEKRYRATALIWVRDPRP